MELCLSPLVGGEPPVELVEHKGPGHPDTICDALAEALSVALCRFYLERFGAVLHHNVDKALLWGGRSRPAFGGGEVLAPIEIFLAGRATREARGVTVPVDELVLETGRAWLRRHLHALDPPRHVRLHPLIRPGSPELVDLFLRQARTGVVHANDTSFGAGYAPASPLEGLVRAAARELAAAAVDDPAYGEDVKVMGVRHHQAMHLTVACAHVGGPLPDLGAYLERREALRRRLQGTVSSLAGGEVPVQVNVADDDRAGQVYLTVTGTSAEAGDDGQVGRGNRANGLITPCRPMTLEAVAGKNPISHVGKLYAVAAHRLAAAIVDELPEVARAEVRLVSQIGRRIDDPDVVDVRVATREGLPVEALGGRLGEVTRREVAAVPTLWRGIVDGAVALF